MPLRDSLHCVISLLVATALTLPLCSHANADEPKPKPENTISIQFGEPIPSAKFEQPPKFWIADVTDRSGNPQPLMVMKDRGGIFLDKQPVVIVREALEQSLKTSNLLAPDAASADLVLRVYLFHFGLAAGSGLDFFGKVEFSTMVKNKKTGASQEVKAAGTSIAKPAVRKKNMQKNVEENIEEALHDAMRNFVRGTQLKDAVAALSIGTEAAPAGTPSAPEKPRP
jgi:hypothetical protein